MLRCSRCDATYEAGPGEPWRCTCGGPLDLAEDPHPDGRAPAFADLDSRDGLWAFSSYLPVGREVSLGEGFTPLVPAPDWDASFTLEYVSPTGSFKDRGAAVTLSRAVELGVDRLVEDSSGNAGAAIATYAARAGIEAEVFVPAAVAAGKLRAIERTGATCVRVEGTRADVTDACIERVESGDAWYASHAWNPAFFAGTATWAIELCAQRDWVAPDAVVSPLGHGTLFLGAYRGFRALREAGWIDSMPRLLGAQAAGVAPIASALHGETGERNDLADGVQIEAPARERQLRDAIERSNGDAIAIGEPATRAALERLHRAGFYVEPTSALAPAALDRYREIGIVEPEDDVVVPLTGSGLKK